MQITVIIDKCRQCRHIDHSGAFTPGGAKPVCGHDKAVELATAQKTFKKVPAGKADDKYHWRHRVIKHPDNDERMPHWCPLRHGHKY